jgi:arginase
MTQQNCILVGAPMDSGKRSRGCLMGPDAYRTAGLDTALADLGHTVTDRGNVAPAPHTPGQHPKLHALEETIAWTHSLADAAQAALGDGTPIFMGGDHALASGTVLGAMRFAQAQNRPCLCCGWTRIAISTRPKARTVAICTARRWAM